MNVSSAPLAGWPALVLNADFRPLSYFPLSLWARRPDDLGERRHRVRAMQFEEGRQVRASFRYAAVQKAAPTEHA